MRYLPHTPDDIAAMLETVGMENLDDLFAHIPASCRMSGDLDLPAPMSEWELNSHMDDLAAHNAVCPACKPFLGAGCYDHHVPAVVTNLLGRSEFVTAYTPYQPEISQGTLQGIYEYQTLVCRLLGMDVANASMYDGASAFAEALLMAIRVTKRDRVAVSTAIHPYYRQVAATYLAPGGHQIVEIPYGEDGRTDIAILAGQDGFAAIAVQSPNFFGCIEDIAAMGDVVAGTGALKVVAFTEPLAYGLLKSPGSLGADIVCGEGRSFGLGQSLGGQSLGMFAARREYVRNMPGRIVGQTVDADGARGFVLTLSTREQHIRRERATSNICTNQSLCALGAAMYMATLGKTGIAELARINYNKAAYLREKFADEGIAATFAAPVFNEFVVKFPGDIKTRYDWLLERGIIGGLPLEEFYPELIDHYLLCATETRTRGDLDRFVKELVS